MECFFQTQESLSGTRRSPEPASDNAVHRDLSDSRGVWDRFRVCREPPKMGGKGLSSYGPLAPRFHLSSVQGLKRRSENFQGWTRRGSLWQRRSRYGDGALRVLEKFKCLRGTDFLVSILSSSKMNDSWRSLNLLRRNGNHAVVMPDGIPFVRNDEGASRFRWSFRRFFERSCSNEKRHVTVFAATRRARKEKIIGMPEGWAVDCSR
jgi:hypothetical protein